jgi:ABC-2 type transport system permease protein
MRWAARFNPVQWGVTAAREVVMPDPDWSSVAGHVALLVGATTVTAAFATWAFRAYRRTL